MKKIIENTVAIVLMGIIIYILLDLFIYIMSGVQYSHTYPNDGVVNYVPVNYVPVTGDTTIVDTSWLKRPLLRDDAIPPDRYMYKVIYEHSGDTTFIKIWSASTCYYTLPPTYGNYVLVSVDTIINP